MPNRNILLKQLMNTRKIATIKGVATLNQARKLIKNVPLTTPEIESQLKKVGFLGGKSKTHRRKTRKLRRRRFA